MGGSALFPGIPPLPIPSLPGSMPPLPFPSLPNAYPFLLPQPSAAIPQLTPAQLQALSYLAPPSQPGNNTSIQLPPPSLPLSSLPLTPSIPSLPISVPPAPALSAPHCAPISAAAAPVVPGPILSLHLSHPPTASTLHSRPPTLLTSSLAPTRTATGKCIPAPASSTTTAASLLNVGVGSMPKPPLPCDSASSPASRPSASVAAAMAAVAAAFPAPSLPGHLHTLPAASRPSINGTPTPTGMAAGGGANNAMMTYPALSALSASLLSGLPGSLSQSLATSFPQALLPPPFAPPPPGLSYLLGPHMFGSGGAASAAASMAGMAGAASAAAGMMPAHPLLAGLSPEAVQRIMAPMVRLGLSLISLAPTCETRCTSVVAVQQAAITCSASA